MDRLDDTSTTRSRPGGRSARVVAAAHNAALDLLSEVGYDGLQLADVARRAGVNKTTVYRRWPNKASLVGDLMSRFTRDTVPTPDTGTLLGDLELLLTEIAEALQDRAVRAVLSASFTVSDSNEEFREARAQFTRERFERSGEIVERAIRRGELSDRVDPQSFLEAAAGPIYVRALFSGDDGVDTRLIEETTARTIRGFRDD